jgi:hypothetical protein
VARFKLTERLDLNWRAPVRTKSAQCMCSLAGSLRQNYARK